MNVNGIIQLRKDNIMTLYEEEFLNLDMNKFSIDKVDAKIYEKLSWRDILIKKYSFPILTEDAVWKLSKYQPILEIGAGTGYWAYEFKKRGVNYYATDVLPLKQNLYFVDDNSKEFYNTDKYKKPWTNIELLSANKAIDKYPSCTLLSSWPSYNENWANEALLKYKGKYFIYEGESEGGCTGNDAFFETLDKYWKGIEIIDIPQWDTIHDYLTVYERK